MRAFLVGTTTDAKAQRQEGTGSFQNCEETGRAGEDNVREEMSKDESEEVSGGQDLSCWAKESGLNSQSLAGHCQNRLTV